MHGEERGFFKPQIGGVSVRPLVFPGNSLSREAAWSERSRVAIASVKSAFSAARISSSRTSYAFISCFGRIEKVSMRCRTRISRSTFRFHKKSSAKVSTFTIRDSFHRRSGRDSDHIAHREQCVHVGLAWLFADFLVRSRTVVEAEQELGGRKADHFGQECDQEETCAEFLYCGGGSATGSGVGRAGITGALKVAPGGRNG